MPAGQPKLFNLSSSAWATILEIRLSNYKEQVPVGWRYRWVAEGSLAFFCGLFISAIYSEESWILSQYIHSII